MAQETDTVENRVFRVGEECYVLYLGSEPDDYKPFLRIGGPVNLNNQIASNIYTVVITSSFTGNPVKEAEQIRNHPDKELRYIGDVTTIRRFEQYLKKRDISLPNLVNYRKIKKAGNKSLVYFYDDGNIKVEFEGTSLFDLSSRERKDEHFLQKSIRLKALFNKNPLRYPGPTFNVPGFFCIDDAVFVFFSGRIVSFGLPEDYYTKLAHHGIDPDAINAVVTDEMNDPLIDLLKRKGHTKTALQIFTNNDNMRAGVDLIVGRGEGTPDIKISNKKGKRVNVFEAELREETGITRLSYRGITFSIRSTPEFEAERASEIEISIVPAHRVAVFDSNTTKKNIKIADGLPYTINEKEILEADVIHEYEDLLTFLKKVLETHEYTALSDLSKVFSGIIHGKKLSTIFKPVKPRLKKLRGKNEGYAFYPIFYAVNLCDFFLETRSQTSDTQKVLESLKKILSRLLSNWKTISHPMPAICDCYISENMQYYFYRLHGQPAQRETFDFSNTILATVEEEKKDKETEFRENTARLLKLAVELSLPPEEREALAREREELKEVKKEEKIEKAVSEGEEEAGKRDILGPRKPAGAGRDTGLKKYLIPLIVLILLAAGIPLFILRPWEGEERAEEEERVGEAEEGKEREAEEEEAEVEEEEGPPAQEEEIQEEEPAPQEAQEQPVQPEEQLEPEAERPLPEIARGQEGGTIDPQSGLPIWQILAVSNRIADDNGYMELTPIDFIGENPDLIYPGETLVLPNGNEYRIKEGDYIWSIAIRYILGTL